VISSVCPACLYYWFNTQRSLNMSGMDTDQRRQWLMRGAVLVVVFAGAVSMHMERSRGWGFLVLCFVAGSVGGLGFVWLRKQLVSDWNRFSKARRVGLIGAGIALVLVGTLILNYGRPDAAANILLTTGGVALALVMWGLYRLFSRLVDALWTHFTNR
jgi:hypothetical protein